MQSPEDVRAQLAGRFARQHRRWFVEQHLADGGWPLALALGRPTEQDLIAQPARVRDWVAAWEHHGLPPSVARVDWAERQWPRLGAQRVPERIVLDSAGHVARLIGSTADARWRRASARAGCLSERWPALAGHAVLGRQFDALADYAEIDFSRLMALLAWADANRASGLYLRQLPVAGLDTKWVAARAGLVADLLRSMRMAHGEAAAPEDHSADLHLLLGLSRPRPRLRVRILCPVLRQHVGGLVDLELPVDQLAGLAIAPRAVLIVENLETGLALPDMPGVVAVMKLGAAVKLAAELKWLAAARCVVYWGDIDTFGFEILNRARGVLPQLKSVLMDRNTLLDHQALCGEEAKQASAASLPWLTADEAEVFEGLRAGRWGPRLRLEQERIPWATALGALAQALQI